MAVDATNSAQIDRMVTIRTMMLDLGPQLPPWGTGSHRVAPADTPSVADVRPLHPNAVVVIKEGANAPEGPPELVEAAALLRRLNAELVLGPKWSFVSAKDGAQLYDAPVPWCDKKAVWVHYFSANDPTTLKLPILNAFDEVVNDFSVAKDFDLLIRSKTETTINPLTSVCHTCYASPVLGIAGRDFSTRTVKRLYISANDEDTKRALGVLAPLSHLVDRTGDAAGFPSAKVGGVFVTFGQDASTEVPPSRGFQRGKIQLFASIVQEVSNYRRTKSEWQTIVGKEKRHQAELAASDKAGESGVVITNVFSSDPCGSLPTKVVDMANLEQLDKIHLLEKMLVARARR